MAITVNVRIVPFGEVVFQTSAPARTDETTAKVQAHEPTHYAVPQETAQRILELRDEDESSHSIVPAPAQ
jgi:hypothetical protein